MKVQAERFVRLAVRRSPYLLPSNLALQMLIYWACRRADARRATPQPAAGPEVQARLPGHDCSLPAPAALPVQCVEHDRRDRARGSRTRRPDDRQPQRAAARHAPAGTAIRHAGRGVGLAVLPGDSAGAIRRTTRWKSRCSGLPDVLVPHLMLQPLVENAIQHGVARRADGGTIRIRASPGGHGLSIRIEDDGSGVRGESKAGIGLSNTRARLESLYGDDASFDLVSRAGRGAAATIRSFSTTTSGGVERSR